MNSIVVATICAMLITFSEADIKLGIPSRNPAQNKFLENIKDACILMGMANYSVSGMGLDSSLVGGCIHINNKKPGESLTKTFTLWLGDFKHDMKQCGQEGMDQIIFSCMEFAKTSLGNTEDGTKYVRLYGQDANKKGVQSIRCALFEKDEIDNKLFRLALSGDNSCNGLSKVFLNTFPRIPRGSKLLRLIREPDNQEHQSRFRRSMSNSTSTSKIQDLDWSYVWMLG